MEFKKGRNINRLALPITRACNRVCPECAAREQPWMYGKGPREPHVSIEELMWVGSTLGPIEKLEVTGGEPSMHPDFEWISENFHDMFKSDNIMLLTNGWLFEDDSKLPLLLNYDWVYVTHYTDTFVGNHGTTNNTDVHDKIKDYLESQGKTKFWSQPMDWHYPKDKQPFAGTPKCYYYDGDSLGYNRGQLYGCCTAWQLPYRGRGIVLTKDWRNELNDIILPCEQCFLARMHQ